MPRVTRTRTIAAPAQSVWRVVADPHHLPRWWPKVVRVEDVAGEGARGRWTSVMRTERGATVRADFRCTGSTEARRFAFCQDIEGTPFAKILRAAEVEVLLEARGPDETAITIINDETPKGVFARLGSGMLRGAARQRLDDALDGLQEALVGSTA